jgi:hypothetical protein
MASIYERLWDLASNYILNNSMMIKAFISASPIPRPLNTCDTSSTVSFYLPFSISYLTDSDLTTNQYHRKSGGSTRASDVRNMKGAITTPFGILRSATLTINSSMKLVAKYYLTRVMSGRVSECSTLEQISWFYTGEPVAS